MGAGKTTLARELAHARGVEHVDTDALLAERFGQPVQDVFAGAGEAAFRAAEEEVALTVLGRSDDAVVSLGGGALGSERVREALRAHTVVLAEVDAGTAWERCTTTHPPGRPLARDRDAFGALLEERRPVYEAAADAFLPAADPGIVRRADAALHELAAAPPGTRMAWARSASGEYPVSVGPGALALRPPGLAGRGFVVTDEHVGELHLASLAEPAGVVEMAAGEEHKNLATAERVWRALVLQGATRADHLVALGGGVVGDLAGFCAATYQRGVPVVQIPTTLVAQVDSAYGGKTAVDLPEAKNYVGAYHQPAAVVTDPDTLTTLPPEERAAGYAEVVKTALIAGGPLWERVRGGGVDDPETVLRCARSKLDIVAADERDDGRRQVLNLGHTVGHAIETATGYAAYRHGEAVALGLLAALRLSGQDDLRAEVAELLAAQGLPHQLTGCSPEAVVDAVARDKKRLGEAPVPFVLVHAPGDVRPGETVGPGALRAV